MNDFPNDWWVPQDNDEAWQRALMQDEAFDKQLKPEPVPKDALKSLLLDIATSSIDTNVKLF